MLVDTLSLANLSDFITYKSAFVVFPLNSFFESLHFVLALQQLYVYKGLGQLGVVAIKK